MGRRIINCPNCDSESVATILFGMPSFSEKLMKDKDEGKVVFGGCTIDERFKPNYQCNECDYQWEKKRTKDGIFAEKDEFE